ncbi:MAG: hypothetical protein M1831_004500 [Alyxoria varia]|nr:MAG: hypothetical protein M1831_004500 [Alyxoria varia]
MLCARCALRASRFFSASPTGPLRTLSSTSKIPRPQPQRSPTFSRPSRRTLSTTSPLRAETSRPTEGANPPPATSTSAAQPFSTPLEPSGADVTSTPDTETVTPRGTPISAQQQSGTTSTEHVVQAAEQQDLLESRRQKPQQQRKRQQQRKIVSSVPAGMRLKGLNYFKGKEDPVAMEDHEYPDWLWTCLESRRVDDEMNADDATQKSTKKSKKSKSHAQAHATLQAQQNRVPLHEQSLDLPSDDPQEAENARRKLNKSMREARRKGIKEGNYLKGM